MEWVPGANEEIYYLVGEDVVTGDDFYMASIEPSPDNHGFWRWETYFGGAGGASTVDAAKSTAIEHLKEVRSQLDFNLGL